MSTEITVAFVQQYNDNVIMLSQQKGSFLEPFVTVESGVVGKTKFFERIGATAAQKRTNRHADTPLVNTPHSRRRVALVPYDWSDLVDEPDQIRMLIRPESKYAINAMWAMGRAKDDVIIESAYGTAYAGEDGSTTVALPSEQKIAQDGTPSSFTLAKHLKVRTLFAKADVDPDDPRVIVISPAALEAFMNTSEVKSADFNTVRVLVNGRLETFLGYKFVESNRLPLVTTGTYRAVYGWTKTAIGLAIGQEVKTRITERADKSYSVQVYVCMDLGGTRIEDCKVAEVPCLATD